GRRRQDRQAVEPRQRQQGARVPWRDGSFALGRHLQECAAAGRGRQRSNSARLSIWRCEGTWFGQGFGRGPGARFQSEQPRADGEIRFFDLVKNAQAKEINAHITVKDKQNIQNPIYSLTFSADGKQLLSSSFDNSIKLWDVASGNLVKEFKPFKVKDFEKGHD